MKPFFIPILFVAWSAATAEPQQLLDSLRAALREEMQTQSANPNSGQFSNLERLLSQLPADPGGTNPSEQSETIRTLTELEVVSQSPKVRALSETLAVDLRNRNAQKAIDLEEKFTYVLRDALTRGLEATTAREVDASLATVARLDEQTRALGNGRPRRVSHTDVLQSARLILFTYQDALLVTAELREMPSRHPELPSEKFRTTAVGYSTQVAAIIPRSELLQRISTASQRLWPLTQRPFSKEEFEKKVVQIISDVKKLADLEAARAEFESLFARQKEEGAYYMESATTGAFRHYLTTYRDLCSGNGSWSFISDTPSSDAEGLSGVRDLLVRFALPRLLQPPPGLTPKEDEPVGAYLQRVLSAASAEADWPLFSRTLETAHTMNLSTVANATDIGSFRLFLGGFNQEQVHYLSGAVSSYLDALRFGSRVIPVQYIGQHLEAIRRQSPQEYAAGVQMSLKTVNTSPPSLVDPRSTRIPFNALVQAFEQKP